MSKKTLSEIPAFKKWVNFFKDKTIEEIEKLSYPDYSKDDEVSRVARIFMVLAMTEEERIRAEQRENALRMYKTEIELREQKGRREKAIEIAKNLLNMGLDINQIAQATGLSAEEIEKI